MQIKGTYNPNRCCPKCGNTGVTTKYVKDECLINSGIYGKILRTCCRCYYEWYEEPLSIKETQEIMDKLKD